MGKAAIIMPYHDDFPDVLHEDGDQQADDHGSLGRADDIAGIAQHNRISAPDAQGRFNHFHQPRVHAGEDGTTSARGFSSVAAWARRFPACSPA